MIEPGMIVPSQWATGLNVTDAQMLARKTGMRDVMEDLASLDAVDLARGLACRTGLWRAETMRMLALALALALPLPVVAQDRACDREWAAMTALSDLNDLSQGAVVAADDWCEAWDLRIGDPEGFGVVVAVDVLRWRGEGFDRLVDGTGLPTTLVAEVEGLRAVPRFGDTVGDWVASVQSEGTGSDGRIDIVWDDATRVLEVREASLDLGLGNEGALTASIVGLDLMSIESLTTSVMSAGLTRMSAEVRVNGAFERYWLLPLATALIPYDTVDPAEEVKSLKLDGIEAIESFPDAIFPGETRAEMTQVVAALPHPRGVLRIEIAATPPLGVPRFASIGLGLAPVTFETWWSSLEGVTAEVDWASLPLEE